MNIKDLTPVQQLLFLYNLKNLTLSNTLKVNNHVLEDIVKNNALTPNVKTLKSLSNYLNITIDVILNHSLKNAVKVENVNLKEPVYIDFYEYVILRSRNIIKDILKDDGIHHEIKSDSLLLISNNILINKLAYEESDSIELTHPIHQILFKSSNLNYIYKSKYDLYSEYLESIVYSVYSFNFASKLMAKLYIAEGKKVVQETKSYISELINGGKNEEESRKDN